MNKGSYEIYNFLIKGDERGSLIAIEQGHNAPFEIKRVYYIFDTKEGVERGFHAHLYLKQIAIAVKEQLGYDLDKKKIQIKEAIRTPGMHLVPVKLHQKVTAELKVHVGEA